MPHNENSRVKIPALVHLTRLGYQYLSLKDPSLEVNTDTNIFIDIFAKSLSKINLRDISKDLTLKIINDIKIKLENEDVGRGFYDILCKDYDGIKLIDLETLENNTFNIVTELPYKNGDDKFRPDITILINGLPLSFIEVKIPNNKDGIQAEYKRMETRAKNKKFRRFINITQLMVFSNNSPYDDTEQIPLEGTFYATGNYDKLFFNHFREELPAIFDHISDIDPEIEKMILRDNNLLSIKTTPEYQTNINPLSHTHKIITGLFSRERFLKLLKYGIAYVEKTNQNGILSIQKHIMRYPQFFATLAIEATLNKGITKGIIWHTQGSGKTALSYFNVKYLKDYYQKKGIIAKFYFIVDRIDLLVQSAGEFRARGLFVEEIDSKEEFVTHLSTVSSSDVTGQDMITVINIQKFSKESISKPSDYNVNIQRIYFMDEAHRSYAPTGSFLANLIQSDRNAVKIALTGTPLIGTLYDKEDKVIQGKGYNTKDIFGDYIHKYYYNKSIIDGYTLRLIREDIQTKYKETLLSKFKEITIAHGIFKKKEVFAHPQYVSALVEYIQNDYYESCLRMNDPSIGGMIVCDSSEQAREIFKELQQSHRFSSALILHNEGNNETRKTQRDAFKKGEINLLVVYNMLLTGFDAPRLKKLYLGRIIKEHSLLQALTRVNRPYEKLRYGYVVDFADISKEFDKTNQAYFKELQAELGDAYDQYDHLFKSPKEIQQELEHIRDVLFIYNTENAEKFSQQISTIDDKAVLLELHKALSTYKELYNTMNIADYTDLVDQFDLTKIDSLYNEVNNRISMVNNKEILDHSEDMSAILNLVLSQIDFKFTKISEEEMVIADQFRELLEKASREIADNTDPKDNEYMTLLEELRIIFKKKNIGELTAEEMTTSIIALTNIKIKAEQKNLQNNMLSAKYKDDYKFMRVHKRLKEDSELKISDRELHTILLNIKEQIDEKISNNEHLLDNESYIQRDLKTLVKKELDDNQIDIQIQLLTNMSQYISDEYLRERNGK